MKEITGAYIVELYALHNQLAYAVLGAATHLDYAHYSLAATEMEHVGEYLDQLETKFAEVLSETERSGLPQRCAALRWHFDSVIEHPACPDYLAQILTDAMLSIANETVDDAQVSAVGEMFSPEMRELLAGQP